MIQRQRFVEKDGDEMVEIVVRRLRMYSPGVALLREQERHLGMTIFGFVSGWLRVTEAVAPWWKQWVLLRCRCKNTHEGLKPIEQGKI